MSSLWKQAYQGTSLGITPLLHLWLRYRQYQGKEDASRRNERIGQSSVPRPSGTLLWVHAASVGESISALPLIDAILAKHPDLHILLTTGTVTSAEIMHQKLPERAIHQFVPMDSPIFVKRFLKHWRPDLAVFVESELWPNLIHHTHAQGCPVMIVNGRMSESSFHWWQRYLPLARDMFGQITKVLAQGEKDADRFRKLGAKDVTYVGNLKYESEPLAADSKEMNRLLTLIGERPVWLAASTHEGEEEQIADVHARVKEEFPELLTMIVPRHASRGDAIESALKKCDLAVARRSRDDDVTVGTDIYLADTMGELGLFYRLTHIVFIGGSLEEKGGQNPLEPARLHCAILCGPHMSNFMEITEKLKKHQACVQVEDAKQLAKQVSLLLGDPERQEALDKAAHDVVINTKGALDTTLESLQPYLTKA
jgi:3-deoxy-D-manno-octulosonic-acid transferase